MQDSAKLYALIEKCDEVDQLIQTLFSGGGDVRYPEILGDEQKLPQLNQRIQPICNADDHTQHPNVPTDQQGSTVELVVKWRPHNHDEAPIDDGCPTYEDTSISFRVTRVGSETVQRLCEEASTSEQTGLTSRLSGSIVHVQQPLD